MINDVHGKYEELKQILKQMDSVAVAYSGGVDSTFLLKAAKEALGERVMAITMKIHSFPMEEYDSCIEFCNKEQILHRTLTINELDIPGFSDNPPNRCYICKKALFSTMQKFAKTQGYVTLVEGSNTDDDGDYRPGLQAIKELGVRSPLKQEGLTKQDIRLLSKELELPTWDKPSLACLSTRFPYGETITEKKLSMVGEGERFLHHHGIIQARVRCHGCLARIEIMPEDFDRIMIDDFRKELVTKFKAIGFSYVSLDLQGYRTGSMNENLK